MHPIKISDLRFKYEETQKNILDGINLELTAGKITAILGLSGCGKTTLCYCMCGIIPHIYHGNLDGEILLFGNPLHKMELSRIARSIGIIFQDPDTQLFSPTVEDEIAFGPENLCLDREEIAQRIEICLKLVNMEKHRFEHPENLSGGEKQLIAIASVLAMDPDLLIFDESLAQIDADGKERVKNVMLQLKTLGKSVVLVEHDPDNLAIADDIFFLKSGKLEAINITNKREFDELYKI